VLDVTEEEADKLLLTLDPLAGMAEADTRRLRELLETVRYDDHAVEELLKRTAGNRLWKNTPSRGDRRGRGFARAGGRAAGSTAGNCWPSSHGYSMHRLHVLLHSSFDCDEAHRWSPGGFDSRSIVPEWGWEDSSR
jgi:hypothetical protein